MPPTRLTIEELIHRHAVLLLDAYGVLVHHAGPLPGAAELIRLLNDAGKPYFILTNDASRRASTSAERFAGMGLAIAAERVISSGSLIAGHFAKAALSGARCVVLGPEDSRAYIVDAGGVVVDPGDPEASVLVICDEVGYDFVDTVDATLTWLFHRIDVGLPLHLILPNPDLVYPKGPAAFGITAGSIAVLIEAALAQRYPARRDHLTFTRLGKPNRPIFEAARRVGGTGDMVMVGDQLGTDIRGALQYGIPAALVEGGLDRYDPSGAVQPTYLLQSIQPS